MVGYLDVLEFGDVKKLDEVIERDDREIGYIEKDLFLWKGFLWVRKYKNRKTLIRTFGIFIPKIVSLQ